MQEEMLFYGLQKGVQSCPEMTLESAMFWRMDEFIL